MNWRSEAHLVMNNKHDSVSEISVWWLPLENLMFLRTVPTFVSAHTFCASRKPWFKRARAGVDIDAINYATKYTS